MNNNCHKCVHKLDDDTFKCFFFDILGTNLSDKNIGDKCVFYKSPHKFFTDVVCKNKMTYDNVVALLSLQPIDIQFSYNVILEKKS